MINKKTGAKVIDLFEALKQSLESLEITYVPSPGDVVALYRPSLDGVVTGPHKRTVRAVQWPMVRLNGEGAVRVGELVTIQRWEARHDAELAEIRRQHVLMTSGFCPDCSEVNEVPERDGYEGTCGECGCDFITDIDADDDGEACFRLIRRQSERALDVARLCQRCVAGVCSEHQPVDASDDRARNDADERGGR